MLLSAVVSSSSSSIDGSLDVGLDAGGICGNTLRSGTGDGGSESCRKAGTS